MLWKIALVWYLGLSAFTAGAMWRDKRAAGAGRWRVRESTLLWLIAAGGFAGALLVMHALNHKTRRLNFRVIPWIAAVVHAAAWILVRRG